MADVDFKIVRAYPERGQSRNGPVLAYEIEDSDGGMVGTFYTPIGSQLSRTLRPDLERDESPELPRFSDWET